MLREPVLGVLESRSPWNVFHLLNHTPYLSLYFTMIARFIFKISQAPFVVSLWSKRHNLFEYIYKGNRVHLYIKRNSLLFEMIRSIGKALERSSWRFTREIYICMEFHSDSGGSAFYYWRGTHNLLLVSLTFDETLWLVRGNSSAF